MLSRIINSIGLIKWSGRPQALYGVPVPEYGVPVNVPVYGVVTPEYGVPGTGNAGIFMRYFLIFLFVVLIPVILFTGVWAFAKRKHFSKKERTLAVVIVLTAYFIILAGVFLAVLYLFYSQGWRIW